MQTSLSIAQVHVRDVLNFKASSKSFFRTSGKSLLNRSAFRVHRRVATRATAVNMTEFQEMPKMMYGTAWKEDRTADLVVQAVLQGFKGVDTACQPKHYQEHLVGEALARLESESGIPRSSLFLQTKFTPLRGQDPARVPYDPVASVPDKVSQSFSVSLENLRTSWVDSLVLHSPFQRYEDTLAAWRAMEDIHNKGGARGLGISNAYDLDLLQRLHADAEVKPSVIQNRFYRESGHDQDIRAWCKQEGIVYQSFWTLTANPEVIRSSSVLKMSQEKGKTPEQLFYRFVIQQGIVPLNGTTSVQHMKEDLDVVNFSLSDDEMKIFADLTYNY